LLATGVKRRQFAKDLNGIVGVMPYGNSNWRCEL